MARVNLGALRAAVSAWLDKHPNGTLAEMADDLNPMYPALRLVRDEPDQVPRLREFRATYPDVIIGAGEFNVWQALIPRPNGETVVTRYEMRALLDRLESLKAADSGEPPEQAG